MKNKLTRKLMLSAFTLLFAVISLGASTYAWFTISNKAEVETFTADVKSAEGIKIGITADSTAEPTTWYTGKLPTEAIEPFYTSEQNPFQFDAVTTTNANLGTFNKLASGVTTGVADGGYIKFTLWIEAEVDGVVSLESLNITGSNTNSYKIDQQFAIQATGAEGTSFSADLEEEWTFNVASAARVALQHGSSKYFYEAPAAEATETVNDENPNTGVAGNSLGFSSAEKGALQYYNKKTDSELAAPNPASSYSSAVFSTMQKIADLEANNAIAIDVYVWIEGWDAECLNAIFGQTLAVSFLFDFDPEE